MDEHSGETVGQKEIIKAIVAAQGEFKTVEPNAENPHFKSAYADLAALRKMAQPILTKHGLAVINTFPPSEDGCVSVDTVVLHTSGERMSCGVLSVPVGRGAAAQAMGSAITYAKRYGLAAILGIAVAREDDDGNAAQHSASKSPASQPRSESNQRSSHEPQPNEDGEVHGEFIIASIEEKKTSSGKTYYAVSTECGLRMSTWEKNDSTAITHAMRTGEPIEIVYVVKGNFKNIKSVGGPPSSSDVPCDTAHDSGPTMERDILLKEIEKKDVKGDFVWVGVGDQPGQRFYTFAPDIAAQMEKCHADAVLLSITYTESGKGKQITKIEPSGVPF